MNAHAATAHTRITPAPATVRTHTRSVVGPLIRFRFRRDRVRVPVWVLVFAFTALFVAAALAKTYGDPAERLAVLRVLATDPTLLALRGAPDGNSSGGFFVVEIGSYLLLMVALMNSFLAVRHSRADEEDGQAELIAATQAGRAASTVATIIHLVIVNILVGLATAVAMMAVGYDAAGSLLLGWSLACTGLVFCAVGLVMSQIFSSARAANGWSSALIGVAWVANAAANSQGTVASDGLQVTPGALDWFTPVGWGMLIRPYTANNPLPGLLSLAFAVILLATSFALQSSRDAAAGLVQPRAGRSWASGALHEPIGLAWRLQRGPILGWGIGSLLGAVAVGGLGKTLSDAVSGNPQLGAAVQAMANGGGSLLESFLGVMMALIGLFVSAASLQTVMRMRQEEARGTAESVLVTRVPRLRWYFSFVGLALGAAAVTLFLSGLVAGLALAGIDSRLVGQAIVLALGQLPAVAVYVSLTAFAFATVPPATIPFGWTLLGLGLVVGEYGTLLGMPEWLRNLAPGGHTVVAPLANADWSGTWVMSLLSLAVIAAAAWLFRRRSLTTV
ncbi:ABC transporter permease [Psychromicrobium xiongbiense]|uniref:ABC transporter permease n=1 Tax=Psychromicrobium xiongbiense TaxID=3051184 RepID=UPI00255427FB|nr:hypothetical protein [Psychromicrobium sp. YIM S02556]